MLVKRARLLAERYAPSREKMTQNRILRPVARYIGNPNVWHFNRHSVARGVALGLFLGFAIPMGLQLVIAAVLAVSSRANLAVTALFTTVSNPVTVVPLGFATIRTGEWLLGMEKLTAANANMMEIIANAPASFLVGGVFFGTIAAAVGFLSIHFFWRWWIARRWQHRVARRRQAA